VQGRKLLGGGRGRGGDAEELVVTAYGPPDVDRGLIESLRLGETSATEHLITIYRNRAYRQALRICGKAEDAEEAVQDAFCAVIRSVDRFRGEAAFSSWLYRIVANAAYDKLRGRRRELPLIDEQGQHVAPMHDWPARLGDESADTELRMTLTSALEELPAGARTLVLLHYVEGLSGREIAAALKISVHNVKVRVHRARLFLRKRLCGAVCGNASRRQEALRGGNGSSRER
jgi:RNA polymerase sigma-70 factor (ECF subfamily)